MPDNVKKENFYNKYVRLAPIDKLREIAKCYGIKNVKDYKSDRKKELIERIIEKQKENGEQCEGHYISSCQQCKQRINRHEIIDHYKVTHTNRKGKQKEINITDGYGEVKYKCNCKNTDLDDTVAVYAHMYTNHNLIKLDKHKQQRENKPAKQRAQKDLNTPKRVRVKKERSNEPRKQKQRTYEEFIAFAKKKFDNKGVNKEGNIEKVLCYQCYKNKKITEIDNREDKIFQHIIHKHQDLFRVECKQCGEIMSSEDNDRINEHIITYKQGHELVRPDIGRPEPRTSNSADVFGGDESVTTSFGNFFNSYY